MIQRGEKNIKISESREYEELVLIVLMLNSNFRCVYKCVPQKKIQKVLLHNISFLLLLQLVLFSRS